MKGKRGELITIIGIVLLSIIILPTVNAQPYTTPSTCNAAGGIWCGTASSGSCALPEPTQPTGYGTRVCNVDVNQEQINVTAQGLYYNFDTLTIGNGVTIHIYSLADGICSIVFSGGLKGSKGQHIPSGRPGGDGGDGGSTCKAGASGSVASMPPGAGGKAGAHIRINAKTIIIEGTLDVSGEDGEQGQDATGEICTVGCVGKGGPGGGGGGGAGIIEFTTPNTITGSAGKIIANGGAGGRGGKQTNDAGSGTQCAGGSGQDPGGAGGGGGGGGAGAVIATAGIQVNVETLAGGLGGAGGCQEYGIGEAGHPGQPGQNNEGGASTDSEQDCNDGFDNDGDYRTDMDDTDCYDLTNSQSQASKGGWDTSIRPFFYDQNNNVNLALFSAYNPSAQNGNDLSCGDDLTCSQKYSTCEEITDINLCASLSSYGCSSSGITQGSCTGTIYCSAYTFHHPSSGVQEGCLPNAPAGCYDGPVQMCNNGIEDVPCWECIGTPNPASCSGLGMTLCNQYSESCTWNPGTVGSCSGGEINIDCTALSSGECLENANVCTQSVTSVNDLGFIIYGNQYACFDNAVTPATVQPRDLSITAPGSKWIWRDAEVTSSTDPYFILMAGKTQYISNNLEWYYCDASGASQYGQNAIPEYGSFEAEFLDGRERCTNAVKAILDTKYPTVPSIVKDCEDGLTACQVAYNQQYASTTQPAAFCSPQVAGGEPPSHSPALQDFKNSCGFACYIKGNTQGNLVTLDEFMGATEDLCSLTNNEYTGCTASINLLGGSGSGLVNQEDCFNPENPQACLTNYFDESKTCAQIASENNMLGTACAAGEYCDGGSMVLSTEAGQGQTIPRMQCCIGQPTEQFSCKPITPAICTDDLNGIPRGATNSQLICLGQLVPGLTPENDCCVNGQWSGDPINIADLEINNSFICYQRGEYNLIQECCDVGDCKNDDNTYLNDYAEIGSGKIYSYSGTPIQSLMTFDDGTGKKSRRLSGRAGQDARFTKNSGIFKLGNWTGFDALYFDIIANSDKVDQIVLVSGTQFYAKDIYDNSVTKKANNRINRIRIPLPTNPDFISKIDEIKINFTGGTSTTIIVDNFFLADEDGSDNSETMYCAGPWKEWVKNLDGPSLTNDAYFWNQQNPSINDYGPHMYACNGQSSFSWTGSVCCGDDSGTGFGEHFVDTAGMCWNGTVVLPKAGELKGQTVAYARGVYNIDLNRILYFEGKAHLCAVPASYYNIEQGIKESFNNIPTTTNVFDTGNNGNAEQADPFTVRGSWICDDVSGWIKLDEFNRIRIIASLFLKEAAEPQGILLGANDKYTLYCDDYREITNVDDYNSILGTGNTDKIQSACIMRVGANEGPKTNHKSFIGMELELGINPDSPDFSTDILKKFDPLGHDEEFTIDCQAAPENPDSNSFFTECTTTSPDFYFYYNRPFNLLIISSDRMHGVNNQGFLGFIFDFWTSFVGVFQNLFGTQTTYQLPTDIATNTRINQFYIAKQGDKQIKGTIDKMFATSTLRIDYHNLTSSVEILAKAYEKTTQISTEYYKKDYQQTIYLETSTNQLQSWSNLAAVVRLAEAGQRTNFGASTYPDNVIPTAD